MPTEQSFMKSLFYGVIPEELIFPYPAMAPDEADNTRMILDSVRDFCAREVDSARIDREAAIPEGVLRGMKELGLFGMSIPQEYGGIGLSATAYARVMQEVAGLDASLAVTLGAHQSIGLKGILLFGTEAQKRKYLPRLASGEWLAAFALTEPGAGSDAASIQTRAELTDDGDSYVLSGSKIWISNGGLADVFTVFARTATSPGPPGPGGPQGAGLKPRITAFIVEKRHGVRSGPPEHKLGIRGSNTTTIYLDDVRVPTSNVLGEVGRGFKVAMEVLNNGRLGLAAGCVGGCRRLIKMATERAQERQAFGRPIGDFGMIKDKIARMLAETYALESMTYLTTGLVDARVADYSLESAICKVFGSETLWRVVNETLQIAAGIGYMQEYPYERMLRDARINLIFEGTNEILRAFIALSGMQGPGRQLSEVARAMREPIKGFGLLSDFAIQRARTALGRERLNRAHPLLRRETVIFEEYVSQLARQVDKVLRRHGKDIAEMQYTQLRVAELAIDLYALAATLARTTKAIERQGEEGARREIELTAAYGDMAYRRMQQVVAAFDENNDELLKGLASRSYGEGGYTLELP